MSLHLFLANQTEDRDFVRQKKEKKEKEKKVLWGILQHKQQVIAYCQTHYDYRPPKMPLKVGSVKFANSLSPHSLVKNVRTGSKSSQGT